MAFKPREDDDLVEAHEINVTPFIDVMLVLLIIFMVAAPLSNVSTPVDLPDSNAAPIMQPDEPITVTMNAEGALLVNEMPVARGDLGSVLDSVSGQDRDQRIFVRADRAIAYGEVMELMNDLRRLGYLKVGLVGIEQGSAR